MLGQTLKKTCRHSEALLPSAYNSGIGLVIKLVLLSFRSSLEADCWVHLDLKLLMPGAFAESAGQTHGFSVDWVSVHLPVPAGFL